MATPTTPPPATWQPLRRRLQGLLFASPVYGLTLSGTVPASLAAKPADIWPGDARRGRKMIDGTFPLAGHDVVPTASPWEASAPDAWRDALESFAWLRDLRAHGGDEARRLAQRLTEDWLARNRRWSSRSWRADLVGRRLAAWIAHFDVFFQSADDRLRNGLLASMARQARHLVRVAGRETDGAARLAAIRGLVFAGVALPSQQDCIGRATALLGHEIPRQFGASGEHVERAPHVQASVLRDLVDMRDTLVAGGQTVPPALSETVRAAGQALQALRHGDGRLALFNGAAEGDAVAVEEILGHCGLPRRRSAAQSAGSFQRLEAGRTVVLMDAGAPPPAGLDFEAHAGTLSIEVSNGRDRIIVNCGPAPGDAEEWRLASRVTAAHSTLTVDDTNSSEIAAAGNLARRVETVACSREESDGATWVDAVHDGYAAPFGLRHRRRLYLAADGDDLRGEDSLEPAGAEEAEGETAGYPFAIRFHLHPAVRVSVAQGGQTALVGIPRGGGWRLRARGASLSIAESVYTGDGTEVRKSQQIVLTAVSQPGKTVVKWALQREG